jgi:ParD-like antitoxin of type II bacterial toxin-antitoxin system
MPKTVSIRFGPEDEALTRGIQARATASRRSFSAQLKYDVFLGQVADDNPDLPLEFIKGILAGLADSAAGRMVPYRPGLRAPDGSPRPA